jgi:thiol-disulfide isomerase/thioredoxin
VCGIIFLAISLASDLWAQKNLNQENLNPINLKSTTNSPTTIIGKSTLGLKFQFPETSESLSMEALRGTVVLLNFWATWCPPCIEEMPSMDELSRRMKAKPFSVIAVSVDEQWEAVGDFLKQLNRRPSFSIAHDPQRVISGGEFGIEKYPESFLIDKKGVIRAYYQGAVNWSSPPVLAKLNEILNEK